MNSIDIDGHTPIGAAPQISAETRRYNRPGAIAAMIMISNPGSFTMVAGPVLLTAFLHGGGLTPSEATTLGAGELAGMTVATLVTTLMVARFDRRMLAAAGLFIALAGHLLSIQLDGYAPILAARSIAGFGVGTMFTVALASLAGLSNPDRAFGISMTTGQIATLILMSVLARVGTEAGPTPVVLSIAIISALVGFALPFIPARAPIAPPSAAVQSGSGTILLPALLALGGTLTFYVGIGAVWPMVGQIGLSHGVPGSVIGVTLAAAGIGAIAAGALVALIGARFGRLLPLTICIVGLVLAMLLLRAGFGVGAFKISVFMMMFFWMLAVPFLLGTLAALDPSGRLAALSGAMFPCGMTLGQLVAAFLIAGGDFARATLIGLPALLFALAMMALAIRAAARSGKA